MEPARWIIAPVDSIAAIFPKVSPRNNTIHMSATFFSPRPAGMRLADTRRVTLAVLISPMVVLKTDWWKWWERGTERWREVVFKERLSGEEGLSYGVGWRLETSCAAPLCPDEWWDGRLQRWPRQGGVWGWRALHCNRSRSLRRRAAHLPLFSSSGFIFVFLPTSV